MTKVLRDTDSEIMLTSKWELRLVYKVSTCLALRRKSQQNLCPRVLLSPCTCFGSNTSMRSSTISTTFLCAPFASSAAFSGRTRTATRMLAGRGTEDDDSEDDVAAAEEDGSAVVEVADNCEKKYHVWNWKSYIIRLKSGINPAHIHNFPPNKRSWILK